MSLPNSCWETELHYAQWSLIDDKAQNMCGSFLGCFQAEMAVKEMTHQEIPEKVLKLNTIWIEASFFFCFFYLYCK